MQGQKDMSAVDGGQRQMDVEDASSEADNTSTGILRPERNLLSLSAPAITARNPSPAGRHDQLEPDGLTVSGHPGRP